MHQHRAARHRSVSEDRSVCSHSRKTETGTDLISDLIGQVDS